MGKGLTLTSAVSDYYRPFLDEWDKGFVDAQEEPDGYWMEVVQGSIPQQLEGTLFRNGPGKFTISGRSIDHPYDGDGFVTSTSFKGGRAYFRSRFVRTAEFEAEERRGEVLFRGTFATQREGGVLANALDVYVKNTSNTNVVCWGGKLLTLFEASQPYHLDPHTLDTLGLDDFGGKLPPGLPFEMGSQTGNSLMASLATLHQRRLGTLDSLPQQLFQAGGEAFTAHPHVDSNTGRLVGFSYQVQPKLGAQGNGSFMSTRFHFWELSPQGEVVAEKWYDMAGFAFLHDFVMTKDYYVIFQNPVAVDNAAYIAGTAPAGSCVRWVPNTPTIVHIIPRPGAPPSCTPRTFSAPSCFIFHHANAYQSPDGARLVVDSIHYDSLPAVGKEAQQAQGVDPDVAFKSRLRRVEVDLATGQLRVLTHFSAYLEMPAVNEAVLGRPHRYVYGYKSDFDTPQIGIARIDTEESKADVWMPGFQQFASEPKFVAKPGAQAEDDGWLITVMFDAGRRESYVAILDATNLAAGPCALLKHRRCIPSALHGFWASGECYGIPQHA